MKHFQLKFGVFLLFGLGFLETQAQQSISTSGGMVSSS